MTVFQDEEIEYLESQLLGRLATVGSDGRSTSAATLPQPTRAALIIKAANNKEITFFMVIPP